jgi:deoxyribonuclease-4
MHNAGYNLNQLEKIISSFDAKIGLNKLLVIHLNDSKDAFNNRKDRHENIGFGTIGFETLLKIAHHDRLSTIPKILETPYYFGKPLYKKEILMLQHGIFDSCLKTNN